MSTVSRVFAALALLGLLAFLSYVALIVAIHVSDIEGPQGDAGWLWIAAGIYGGLGALLFGALAMAFRRKP